MVKSGITQEEIISWGGPEVFNQGLALCNSGAVTDVEYDDESLKLSGKIERDDGWAMPVSLTLEAKGRIVSHCPCYANQKLGQVCPHVTAIAIAQTVLEMDSEDEPEPTGASAEIESDDEPPEDEHGDFIEVPMKPGFYAFVTGSRASISIALDAWYGDIDFPACSLQPSSIVRLPDPDDDMVRRVRSLESERAAMKELEERGFERGYRENDMRLYLTNPQKVMDFLGAGIPALRRRGWKIELSEGLEKIVDAMPSVLPIVRIKDAPGGAFDVRYAFEAGGREIPATEIQAALNRGDGCLLRDGGPVLLDNVAIETMHDVFRDCAASQNGAAPGWFRVGAVHAAYVASSLASLGDVIDVDSSEAALWSENATRRGGDEGGRYDTVSLGELGKSLRPYQKTGVYWMRHLETNDLSGLLAGEMGLGKTLQTLAWLALPRANAIPRLPALIVAPTSLVKNWEAEAKKFTPRLKTLVVSGPGREELFGEMENADIVITSYALLQRDFEEAYMDREFSVAVIDEAQHIKNRQTKTARIVKMLNAKRRLALTGTPVENSVGDVWSIFNFLMPDYLGDYETFKLRYEDPVSEGVQAEIVLAKLKRKLDPFIMRRVKKTVAKDLPDKITKVSLCPLSEEAASEYSAALAKTRRQASDAIRAKGMDKSRFELLAMLMRLRQIASRGKYDAFKEQLTSAIEGDHRVLVFSQFVKTLKAIGDDLKESGIKFCYLDGSTKDRLGECNRFNKDRSIPVFLISLMAGGTGLNLTGADMVIHYDPWWNPAVEDQATDRAHRIGQKKNVYVVKMIAADTVEEKVLALQKRKQAVISATVGATDAAIMEKLTAEDVKELLS